MSGRGRASSDGKPRLEFTVKGPDGAGAQGSGHGSVGGGLARYLRPYSQVEDLCGGRSMFESALGVC